MHPREQLDRQGALFLGETGQKLLLAPPRDQYDSIIQFYAATRQRNELASLIAILKPRFGQAFVLEDAQTAAHSSLVQSNDLTHAGSRDPRLHGEQSHDAPFDNSNAEAPPIDC